jgi:hypothetical protein
MAVTVRRRRLALYCFDNTLIGVFLPPTGAEMNSTEAVVATTVPLPFLRFGVFTGVFAQF